MCPFPPGQGDKDARWSCTYHKTKYSLDALNKEGLRVYAKV